MNQRARSFQSSPNTDQGASGCYNGSAHRRTAFFNMHADTAAAVRALVAALQAHPEDLQAMNAYGHLPQHLIDFIEDHEDDLENELI